MHRCLMLPLLFCLWPGLAIGQTHSASANDKETSAQDKPKLTELIAASDGGWVSAKGVWRPDKPAKKDELVEAVAELSCFRHGGNDLVGTEAFCLQATAMVVDKTDGALDVWTRWLKVIKWNETQIIATDDSSICVTSQTIFDLKQKTVIALDVRKAGAQGLRGACNLLPDRQTYYLQDVVDYFAKKWVAGQDAQQKAQPAPPEQALKTGYVKCDVGEVSIWRAIGDLTVVASPKCGDKLDVLQDGELWMKVRTEHGTVGYIPTAAVADSPDSEPKAQQAPPTTAVVSPPSAPQQAQPATPAKKQHPIRDAFLAALSGAAKGASEPSQTNSAQRRYFNTTGRHWITEISEGGALITLQDGSRWEIRLVDRVKTSVWVLTNNISVQTENFGLNEYVLLNTDDGEKARAKYLGE